LREIALALMMRRHLLWTLLLAVALTLQLDEAYGERESRSAGGKVSSNQRDSPLVDCPGCWKSSYLGKTRTAASLVHLLAQPCLHFRFRLISAVTELGSAFDVMMDDLHDQPFMLALRFCSTTDHLAGSPSTTSTTPLSTQHCEGHPTSSSTTSGRTN
jgi:hypothetical protein